MTNPHSPDGMASDNANVGILLATYNGAAFLAAQLDSILAQTHENWRLVIRDDGSTDKTPEILEAFRARHQEKVVILEDEAGNLGLVQNFSRLMEQAGAGYIALCDQDDVWKPEKLELSLQKMRTLEAEHGTEKPLLVFTDLTVVDEDLRIIHPSFWRYQGLRPERCNALNRLLLQNVVTGCTALMNRPLMQKAVPIPEMAHVHDWWIALVAAAFGSAGYVAEPTVLYRQHGENIIGAKSAHLFDLPARAFQLLRNFDSRRKSRLAPFSQAYAFYKGYSDRISDSQEETIKNFLHIPEKSIIFRIFYAIKCRCFPTGILRMAAFLVICRGKYR